MKLRIKVICSALATMTWFILAFYRSMSISSGEFEIDSVQVSLLGLALGLVGLYIGVELLIAPESAALYILYNTALPRWFHLSSSSARIAGILAIGGALLMGYSSLVHLFGLR